MADILRSSLKQMDILFTDAMIGQLERHLEEIRLFNPSYKLVSDPYNTWITRHVLDSLSGYHVIRDEARQDFSVADLGSGAGFPGVPLAIMMPDIRFTLVERMGRRAGFLKNVLATTGLYNRTSLIFSDVRQVNEKFDMVVMRAFHPLYDIAAISSALLTPNGSILAYKATDAYLNDELDELERRLPGKFKAQIIEVAVPGLKGQRKLCLLKFR